MVVGRFAGDSVKAAVGGPVLLRAAVGVGVAGIATATLLPWVPAVFIGLFIAALGISVLFPELYDSAARHSASGNTLGALTAGSITALFAGPALVGLLADTDQFGVGGAIAAVTIPSAVAVVLLSRVPVDQA